MLKEQITSIIKDSLQTAHPELDVQDINVIYQVPKNKENGDLSTNVAMQLTKKLGMSPQAVATFIIEKIEQQDIVSKVEMAGPGFLNFFLKKEDVFSQLDTMIAEDVAYGQQPLKDEYLNIEYVSVNPTGDLHIGHARGAVYGDVIANLLKKDGVRVTKEYYINDAGNQIDKLGASVRVRYDQLLGKDVEMIEDGYNGSDIIDIAQELVDNHDETINALSEDEQNTYIREYALKEELRKIKEDLTEIKVNHDVWFSERTLYQEDKITDVLKILADREMTYESEGALWLKSTQYGDDKDRVLIKTDGSYTYLTPDIAYHYDKLRRLDGDNKQLLDILGGDHHGYVARMKAALQTLGFEEDILSVRLIQMVRFIQDGKEVKMSKRTGNSITMRELVEEVGVDATRYFFSMRNCDTPLDFDMTLATEDSSNNPVYYAQYAHARICSIIRNAEKLVKVADLTYNNDYSLLVHEKEHALAIKLNQYTDVIKNASQRLEPFKITNYIQELAQTFHGMYNAVKVVDESNLELTQQRLKLMLATRAVLRSSFEIIGISAPVTM